MTSASTRPGGPSGPDGAPGSPPTHAIVPVPVHLEHLEGRPFLLRPGVRIVVGRDPTSVSTGVLVAARVGQVTGFSVAVVEEDDGTPDAIVLALADHLEDLVLPDLDPALATEAYRLEVNSERITLTALTGAGLVRGMVTLQHLAERDLPDVDFAFPPVLVVDHPRFAWRGLSLDVARHFFGVDDIKAVINVMAAFKLNVLHLHLTDDQGWRLHLPSRPELTERSGASAVGGDPGGFYTPVDYAEILTYAASRYVTVVPEVDVPGHVNAALHAYGDLNPTGEPAPVHHGVDAGFSRLHAGLPATSAFLRDVLGDVAAMTPGGYVHIGGDEALTVEPGEYAELVGQAIEHVRAAGKAVVGWQEIAPALQAAASSSPAGRPFLGAGASAGAPPVVQYWDERAGAEEVLAAVALGAKVLLSPARRTYLDMRYDPFTLVGSDWAGHLDVRQSYLWEPLDSVPGLSADEVIGVSAVLWTETVRTSQDLFLLLLPRLAALAEVAWSAPQRRDWDSFAARLPAHTRRWDEAGLTWYRSAQIPW